MDFEYQISSLAPHNLMAIVTCEYCGIRPNSRQTLVFNRIEDVATAMSSCEELECLKFALTTGTHILRVRVGEE